jgi:hypothetical protein
VEAILEAIAEEPDSRPDWQEHLLQNAGELFDFIWLEKFRKSELPCTNIAQDPLACCVMDWLDLTVGTVQQNSASAANAFPEAIYCDVDCSG